MIYMYMITADDSNRNNAAKKLGLTNTVPSVEELCDNVDRKLFKAIHCLHTLLPPVSSTFGRNMRERGHYFQLPSHNEIL